MGLKEIGRQCVDCIHLGQDGNQMWALVNAAMDLRVL
jgi:hypothetical protein